MQQPSIAGQVAAAEVGYGFPLTQVAKFIARRTFAPEPSAWVRYLG